MTTNRPLHALWMKIDKEIDVLKNTQQLLTELELFEKFIEQYNNTTETTTKVSIGKVIRNYVSDADLSTEFEEYVSDEIGAGGECASFDDYDWSNDHYVNFLEDYINNIKIYGIKGVKNE